MKSLTFNGERKPWIYLLEGRQKAPFAPRNNNLLRVPGMPGAYLKNETIDVLYITQPVGFVVEDDADALTKKDELAEWLLTGKTVELKLDDEPGRTYFAKLEGTIEDYQKFVDQRRGTLTFLCPDPYSYGPELEFIASSGYFSITNTGTAEAEPIFEFEVTAPVTFLMIQNQLNEYMMIGEPADDDVQVVDSRELIFSEDGNMDGWMTNGTEIDPISGAISNGTMTHDGTGIIADDYGSPVSGNDGYGPAIIKELPEAIEDFEISTIIDTRTNDLNQNFRVELYAFDEGMNMLGKIGIHDGNRNFHERNGLARVGEYVDSTTRYFIHSGNFQFRNSGPALTFFIKWKREGINFEFNIYRIVNGELRNWTRRRFKDRSGQWLGRLKYIQAYIRTYRGRTNPNIARVNQLKVEKLLQVTEDQTPYIAYPGDIITFNHTNNGQVYINGEVYEENMLGVDYFTLKKGDNEIAALPSDSFNISGRYRRRYS
ncbi:putative phage tail component, N-terminal domain-containing protein [Gracilibacillus orientalis]|uniref:Putative phage tail component, N-terminal domain-containing protein n=1 Tax=Gracilibacillus orientalis TaxID=334253 RepID=A0A1I4HBB8_9BACI|nr:distal tail protein Dit [Gracilibacillus orientalis]SFL38746.1 putative phage tail component, N-terminal domain-containing protein [Gracilibacillus orientalis]